MVKRLKEIMNNGAEDILKRFLNGESVETISPDYNLKHMETYVIMIEFARRRGIKYSTSEL